MLPYLTEVCLSLATTQATPTTRKSHCTGNVVSNEGEMEGEKSLVPQVEVRDGEAHAKLLWVAQSVSEHVDQLTPMQPPALICNDSLRGADDLADRVPGSLPSAIFR